MIGWVDSKYKRGVEPNVYSTTILRGRRVKPNDYSITILERGGSSQLIAFDYIGGRGSQKTKKIDYVILEQPHTDKWIVHSAVEEQLLDTSLC